MLYKNPNVCTQNKCQEKCGTGAVLPYTTTHRTALAWMASVKWQQSNGDQIFRILPLGVATGKR